MRIIILMKGCMKIIMFFQVEEILLGRYFVEMSLKVTVMNEVNNFASVTFGHCEKSKHFALEVGIFLCSKTKCLDFPQCPPIIEAHLTSKYTPTIITLLLSFL